MPMFRSRVPWSKVLVTTVLFVVGILFLLPFLWMLSASFKVENDVFKYPIESGIAAATTAVTGLIGVLGVLSTAILAVRTAMGPVMTVISLIAGAATAFGAYTLAANAAKDAANDFAESQERINDVLRNAPYNLTLEQYKTLQKNMEKLNEVLERRNKLEKEYNERLAAARSGQGSIENTHRIFELADAIKAVDKELKCSWVSPFSLSWIS